MLVKRKNILLERPGQSSGTSVLPADFSKPGLFALIVGINSYKSKEFSDLCGAVPDARLLEDYLKTDLKVPSNQICVLLDQAASCKAIIEAFIALKNDERIKKGAPILIFFAGHGSELQPSDDWASRGLGITMQMLVPQDYCSKSLESTPVPGIPDRTIAALLQGIAEKKGDNITVVFDCCHSASGTRGNVGPERVRSVVVDFAIHTEDLDQEILESVAFRIPNNSPRYLYYGLRSHILISACGSDETARERYGRGKFTTAFIKLLRTIPLDKLRYSDILTYIDVIPGQNPQCEGINQHRYLFDGKVAPPSPASFICRYDEMLGKIIIDAGTAHGVSKGTEFGIYHQRDLTSRLPLGTLTADKVTSYSSVVTISKLSQNSFLNALRRHPSPELVAVRTKAGQREHLYVYITPRNYLSPFEDPAYQFLVSLLQDGKRDLHNIAIARGVDHAHLELTIENHEAIFHLRDKTAMQYGYAHQFRSVAASVDEVARFLTAASKHYWDLRRASDDNLNEIASHVQLSFYRLQESQYSFYGAAQPEMFPVGDDLCQDGVVDFSVGEDRVYGIKLTNNSSHDLYPSLFYFDSTDFNGRVTYYKPCSSGQYVLDVPLKKDGGTLTIGYGSGGVPPFAYSLQDGRDITIGFLKLLVFTKPVDPSTIPASYLSTANLRETATDTWGATVIPIVQRRPTRERLHRNPQLVGRMLPPSRPNSNRHARAQAVIRASSVPRQFGAINWSGGEYRQTGQFNAT
ncbi:hypothetical protein BDZ97DRAFT_1790076 [Flammula alnicola]|nr:hypothetical protein BDZ97DRAFT_1790076 [Flammula alnicola]